MNCLNLRKVITVVVATIFWSAAVTQADVSPEKRSEIEKLLRLSGMEKLSGQMINQMITSMKAQMPQVPQLFWTKFQEKIDLHEFIEKVIPIYDKYYTIDDLRAVNAFYESPAGRKVLSTLPQLMQETMKIGQEWGQKLGKQAAEEAEQELKQKSAIRS